jgi:hypothetical protein
MMTRKNIIRYLENEGWELVCENPFEMEMADGFNIRTLDSLEYAQEEVSALMHSKALYKALHNKEQEKKKAEKRKALIEFKKVINNLVNSGINENTLFELYLTSCNFGHRFNPSEKCLRDCFKGAIKGN